MSENIKTDEKACYHCEYLLGHSAFSFGLRCKHPENQKEEMLPIISNPKNGCSKFEKKICFDE